MSKEVAGIVFYCDGGANPNPNGPSGSGVHGYSYNPMQDKEKPTRIESWIATDRGYILKKDYNEALHKGVVIDEVIEIVDAIGLGTNNIAEMNAVLVALEFANTYTRLPEIHIICDSEYTLKGMSEWSPNWKKRNWTRQDGTPPANVGLWKKIDELKMITESRSTLTTGWTKGHSDDFGNSKADFLATIAVTRSHKQKIGRVILQKPAADYFVKLDTIHPFLSLKRVFFNTNEEFYRPGVYFQSDGSGKEFVTGKRTSEATFSVVCLAEVCDVVDAAVKATISRKQDFNRIVYGRIDMLRSQDLLFYIHHWGEDAFLPDRRNLNLNFLDRRPVVVEVRPDELPLRAFDSMAHLESILVEFQSNYLSSRSFFEGDTRNFKIFDVTEHFYTTRTKRSGKNEIEIHELKKDFGVGIANTRIKLPFDQSDSGEINVILSFGEDVPPRNSFKHFELLNPVVHVVTWHDSDHLVRYATIVKTDDAVGIWSNYFANYILLKK